MDSGPSAAPASGRSPARSPYAPPPISPGRRPGGSSCRHRSRRARHRCVRRPPRAAAPCPARRHAARWSVPARRPRPRPGCGCASITRSGCAAAGFPALRDAQPDIAAADDDHALRLWRPCRRSPACGPHRAVGEDIDLVARRTAGRPARARKACPRAARRRRWPERRKQLGQLLERRVQDRAIGAERDPQHLRVARQEGLVVEGRRRAMRASRPRRPRFSGEITTSMGR
jgi:hypothetical protein